MKTPDEFIRVVAERKANGDWKSGRRKPAVIIVTVILALILLAAGGSGVIRLTLAFERVTQSQDSLLGWLAVFVRALIIAALASATLYACFNRPRWGRAVSIVFGMVFCAFAGYVLVVPDPHPVFQIAPGAEQVGAYIGQAMMALGIIAYARAIFFGAKAKAYFSGI
ncbi:hypothetical protein [Dyella sp. 2YAF14]|uniref:hypothetical protein n=1 Tax=Dyella sp. 2YAF14 TaxID=3233025 RepID=UPI003F8EA665